MAVRAQIEVLAERQMAAERAAEEAAEREAERLVRLQEYLMPKVSSLPLSPTCRTSQTIPGALAHSHPCRHL